MDLTVYLFRVRTTRPQVSTRWFPAFDYVADANEVIEEKVDVVAAERERWARIAGAAQAVTVGCEDTGEDFILPSHLMASLALALDEGPNV